MERSISPENCILNNINIYYLLVDLSPHLEHMIIVFIVEVWIQLVFFNESVLIKINRHDSNEYHRRTPQSELKPYEVIS